MRLTLEEKEAIRVLINSGEIKIFTTEIVYCDGNVLQIATDNLQDCIDMLHKHETWPNLGSNVLFTAWHNGKKAVEADLSGYRYNIYAYPEKTSYFTLDEVIDEMKPLTKWGLNEKE